MCWFHPLAKDLSLDASTARPILSINSVEHQQRKCKAYMHEFYDSHSYFQLHVAKENEKCCLWDIFICFKLNKEKHVLRCR